MIKHPFWAILLYAFLAISTLSLLGGTIMNEPLPDSLSREISGDQLKALMVAYKNFNFGLISKKLSNYTILIEEQSNEYRVTFVPKLLDNEAGYKGGRSELGTAVRYQISKSTYKILKKSFTR